MDHRIDPDPYGKHPASAWLQKLFDLKINKLFENLNVQIIAPDEEFINRNSHIWTCDRKYEHISWMQDAIQMQQFRCNNTNIQTDAQQLEHQSCSSSLQR